MADATPPAGPPAPIDPQTDARVLIAEARSEAEFHRQRCRMLTARVIELEAQLAALGAATPTPAAAEEH